MPEINPYEPPQSKLHAATPEKNHATPSHRGIPRWIVIGLIGLQIIAGIWLFIFIMTQVYASSWYYRLKEYSPFVALIFFILGMILMLIALARRSNTLMGIQVLTLTIFIYLAFSWII